MRFRFFRNPYKRELDRAAKTLKPSQENCNEILDSVLVAAGVTTVVSFSAAALKLTALGRAALLKAVTAVMAVTTSVAVVGAATTVMLTPPSIEELQVELVTWTQSSIVITTGSGIATRTVTIFPQQGEPIPAVRVKSGRYQADVTRNGAYRIEVIGQSGRTASADVAITEIDDQIPVMSRYDFADETVTIYFTDDRSGVNWDTIYAVDSQGNILSPLSTDAKGGWVTFSLPRESLAVYAEDFAGNIGVTTVFSV